MVYMIEFSIREGTSAIKNDEKVILVKTFDEFKAKVLEEERLNGKVKIEIEC